MHIKTKIEYTAGLPSGDCPVRTVDRCDDRCTPPHPGCDHGGWLEAPPNERKAAGAKDSEGQVSEALPLREAVATPLFVTVLLTDAIVALCRRDPGGRGRKAGNEIARLLYSRYHRSASCTVGKAVVSVQKGALLTPVAERPEEALAGVGTLR